MRSGNKSDFISQIVHLNWLWNEKGRKRGTRAGIYKFGGREEGWRTVAWGFNVISCLVHVECNVGRGLPPGVCVLRVDAWCCYQLLSGFFVSSFPIWDSGGNTFDAALNAIVCVAL